MLTPTHITGISAFSTVCMELFIHSTLVKTQRLKIRIYCDTKNNIFIAMFTLHKNPKHLKNHVIYRIALFE
jgi:hypothetical protein